MTRSTAPMWFVVAFFATIHFFASLGLIFYCLVNWTYEQGPTIHPIWFILLSPAVFLFSSIDSEPIILLLVLLNSVLWGCILAKLFGRWFAWPL